MSLPLSKQQRILLLTPSLIGIGLFVLLPTMMLVGLSLQRKHAFAATGDFIGFDHFAYLLQDPEFLNGTWFTIKYTVATVFLQLAVGFMGALALIRARACAGPLIAIFVLPYVLPTILTAVVWRWMLHDTLGVINLWGRQWGLLTPADVWFDRSSVLATLVLVSTWQFFPFVLLLCYARLTSISRISYEAAAVDGLSPIQSFWRVTLPEMRFVILTVLLLRGLWMFTKFDIVWLLVGRQAVGQYARTLPILAYTTTFDAQQAGLGAAIALSLVLFLVVVVGLYLRLTSCYRVDT